jgi:uncharacterized protein (UPF0264 family)
MRLLVSVRSAEEAATALVGGAEIIDAKEPSRGSLGPVSEAELSEIAAAVPRAMPLSVALGDLTTGPELDAALARVRRAVGERDPLYLKLGFAGTSAAEATRLGRAAVAVSSVIPGARVIFVAYADHLAARSPSPNEIVRIAGETGAAGILLDTHRKDGTTLLDHIDDGELRAWTAHASAGGRLVALAGSMDLPALNAVRGLPVDVVGVRTAACAGGRSGKVTAAKVRELRARLERVAGVAVSV